MVISTETQKVQRITSEEIKSILDTIKWRHYDTDFVSSLFHIFQLSYINLVTKL